MALELEKETNFGVKANYWYVAYFQKFSFKERQCEVFLHGFPNKEARTGTFEVRERNMVQTLPNSPVGVALFQFHGDEFDFDYDDNITVKCYEKIKKNKEWKGAKDV